MHINCPAPDFSLPDLRGNIHRLIDYRGWIVVVNFWSAECGWSEQSDSELQKDSEAWKGRVLVLRVASNACETVDMLWDASHARGLDILLVDSAALVADLYGAQVTPHCFVVDAEGVLRYQGAFDDRTFRQRTATRVFLREAVEALLAGRLPDVPEAPPYGCTLVRE